MKHIFIFSLCVFTQCIQAQKWNDAKVDSLTLNRVHAKITNNADCIGGYKAYEVPAGSNCVPLYASNLWVGGYSNGMLRVAAMTYRQNGVDFWPGPIDTINAVDTNAIKPYTYVWKINRTDIADFVYNWNAGNVQNGSFVPATSILTWPAHGAGGYSRRLAPFVDVNGDGIYDPMSSGDYPLIRGDQMAWWMFNDSAGSHTESGGAPMGLEVHGCAYVFTCPSLADSERVLNYTTFYNFDIIHRGPEVIDTCILGLWMDTELGNYLDDYVGCDVMNNYGFTYNGDNFDDNSAGITGYHGVLPALSCNVLKGPPADVFDGRDNNNNGIIDEPNENCLMEHFMYYLNTGDPQTGNPNSTVSQQFMNYLGSRWKNGTHLTYGGKGILAGNPACNHAFPGTSDPYGITLGGSINNPITPPVTNWTQQTGGVAMTDMRFLIGLGPFTMQPASHYEVDYALVFSQDSTNCANGNNACILPRAQQDNIRVKRWFDNNSFPSCASGVGIKEDQAPALNVNIYPNPANDQLFVEFKEMQGRTTIEIFDMLGNIVKGSTFTDTRKYAAIPVQELATGVYMVRIKTGSGSITRKFIKE